MAKYEFTTKGPQIIWLPFWIFVSARPRQWLKNLALFAPLVFEGVFFDPIKFWLVVLGFFIFSLATSSIYIINDVIDVEKDRAHPFKRKRPIAAGRIHPNVALIIAILGLALAIFVSSRFSPFFTLALSAYAILQILYSLFLRSIILIDVMAIASGFLLRVFAGAVLIDAHVTVWFILTVASLALFLAIGKRRSERTLLMGSEEKSLATRSILLHYPESLLDSLTVMFATATWFSYTMFTFLQPPPGSGAQVLVLFGDYLPRTFLASKWLMVTVPFVIYGVMRYMYVIHEKKEGESPERVLLSDIPLLSTVLFWIVIVFFVIYGGEFLPQKLIQYLQ
ncbi:MAG: UbiA prenyltransferase family protein [Candidatus Curtissbacteria bacterium]|nr:UbiA prenyltransferase family protein [Candidatus Curtissbacteria bacterium]